MIAVALGLLLQTAVAAGEPVAIADSLRTLTTADSVLAAPVRRTLGPPRWDLTLLTEAAADTGRRRKLPSIEYSDIYHTRVGIHRTLSYVMIPLFVGSAYTGFQLRNKKEAAPKWTRDIHGPLAAGTAIVFGMNTLTGVWNLWEGRQDPDGRGKRLLHGALFIAAAAGFTYVTAAGDNISDSGRANHWHRDIALGSMTVSLVSWSLMLFR